MCIFSLRFVSIFAFTLFFLSNFSYSEEENVSPEPSPEQSMDESSGVLEDEEVPLDAWIIPKKEEPEPSLDVSSESPSEVSSLSEDDRLNEEKRIYKALLEEYQRDAEETTEEEGSGKKKSNGESKKHDLSHLFKKTALSKRDQARVNRIRSVQRGVVSEQKRLFAELLKTDKEKSVAIRVCNLNYPAMGFPSELRKIDSSVKGAGLTSDWKNGVKLITQKECDLVLYTGLFAKTTTKINEFLEKTTELLGKGTGVDWGYKLNSSEANSEFAVLYVKKSIEVIKAESLVGLTLRRGGPFEESEFSLTPLEVTIESRIVDVPRRYSFLLFDLRDRSSPLKKPKIHHQIQMSSALLEATINRINQKVDEAVILLGNIGENKGHPAFQVLQGVFSPADFLEGQACKLLEDDEKLFECDNAKLPATARGMLGVFSGLHLYFEKAQKVSLARNALSLSSDFFISPSSINYIKNPKHNNKLLGASFDVIKGKQFQYTFLYLDMLAQNKE